MSKLLVFLSIFLFSCIPDPIDWRISIDSFVPIEMSMDSAGIFILSSGSGFVTKQTDVGAFVVTAAHVCDGDGYLLAAKRPSVIVRVNTGRDLCELFVAGLNRRPVKVADNHITKGERVYAITSPFGLYGPDFVPIVEGLYSGHMSPEPTDHFMGKGVRWEIFSLPINQGSSGGMIVNNRGEVISMVVRTFFIEYGYEQISAGVDQQDLIDFINGN